ncbi:hypothetical protein SETIT_4G155700v2 [Setaria italica]|uniref:Uncharacterized protein n=1 Tax=Setaria italica TaxID=4555 RepID=A0A368QUN8_SETIT|nr:hypothetical protein SETIT_4G155700v2 [Setaria italica]
MLSASRSSLAARRHVHAVGKPFLAGQVDATATPGRQWIHHRIIEKSGVSHCITWHPELLPTVPLYASLGSSLMVWFLTWVAGQSSVNDLKVSAEVSMLLINTILTEIENGIYPKGSF